MKKKVFVVSSFLVIEKFPVAREGFCTPVYGLEREHTGARDHATVSTNQHTVRVVSREYTCSFQSCFVLQ